MEPFARTINAAMKYVVSSTLDRVDWNAELVRGDLRTAVQQLKQEPGKGLGVGGVKLPQALAELGRDQQSAARGGPTAQRFSSTLRFSGGPPSGPSAATGC